jgi:5-methylcytosine-specific restriction protein A
MVRDGGCVFPGCDRKPKWCDAHHLKPWEDDGPTDLDNGCLLCRRHHTLIHHRGWTLERAAGTGTFTATSPDGRPFTCGPHDRCRP